jgi:SpoVK/Ycf46/Vps4 family AAA+-type ATPase
VLKLDDLIGLTSIKSKIHEYLQYLEFQKLREEKGIAETEKISLHAVFTGNPGTGKTTVARLLSRIYAKMGLLSKGHLVEVDRADLVAEYIGQTAPKTKEVINRARGGVLFIDEAYSLARKADDSKDFGREVIEILMKEMSDGKGDLAVIVAGYPEEMDTFLDSNPGLKSRFNMYYDFPDYLPQELDQIAQYAAKERHLSESDEAKKYLYEKLVEAYRLTGNRPTACR